MDDLQKFYKFCPRWEQQQQQQQKQQQQQQQQQALFA